LRPGITVGVVAAAVPAASLAIAVWLVATPWFLRWEYGRPGFPAAAGFTSEERLALAVPSTLYLTRPGVTTADLESLTHEGRPLYEPNEVAHLVDVRRLVRTIGALGLVGAVVITGTAWRAAQKPEFVPDLGRGLALGGLITVTAVVAVAGFVATAWSYFFTAFHEVLFPPGTWQFSTSSGLIRLFPEQFWFDSAIALMVAVVLIGVAAVVTGIRIRRGAIRGPGWSGPRGTDIAG
jgi:integral membrane protein (TIGR01906 family)